MTHSAATLPTSAQPLADMFEHELKQDQLEVPLLPEIAGRVVHLTQDPDSDASQLAQLIQSDQALAGHVMRIANSAAYSPNTSLISLQQAITRLGINLISDIALAASISTKMFNTPGFEQEIKDLWRHSLATALWSKEIARHCRFNVEATFLCGLLHAIGWPVALQTILEKIDAEQLACDKACVTALANHFARPASLNVLAHWDMPSLIAETITYFDTPSDAPNVPTHTAIVHAASRFATHMISPDQISQEELCQSDILADLNMYPDEVQKLLNLQEDIASTMESMSG